MPWVPKELEKVKAEVDAGKKDVTATVRELLRWFLNKRRGRHVVAEIRSALRHLDLKTIPDFDSVWVDSFVTFERRGKETQLIAPVVTMTAVPTTAAAASSAVSSSSKEPEESKSPLAEPPRTLEGQDPSYSVRKLDAANRPPATVNPNTTVSQAVTTMLAHDFSQLPVMQGERSVKGLFSWKSLASRLALKKSCETVSEAMDNVRTVSGEASIFQVAEILATDEVVLVQASATDNRIVGIVTTADMADQFASLGEPFLLIGEIENRIRVLIDGKFGLDELKAAKNPGDGDRQIDTVADLTFGEYVRLLQDPASWKKCKLNIDRGTFIKHLEEVRDVRNDVMHFEPEGIGPEALASLRQFAQFLSRLARLSSS